MVNSPFIYGTTVSNEAFINRKSEIAKLTGNLSSGVNTTLISPRRWGKSSLVEMVSSNLLKTEKDLRVASIDLFTVNSEEQFMEKFAREIIKASSSKWEEWIKNAREIFKMAIPKIHIGVDPVHDFNLSFDWSDLNKSYDEILNLPETIAQKKGTRFVVCIDEFQNIAGFSDFTALEKKLRAVWQRQKLVTYCIFGSQRHMMTEIFNNPSKPFYRFGDIMLLPKIMQEEWVGYITKSFKRTGKSIGKGEASLISNLMQCHSWYVQQLAHYTWNLTSDLASRETILQAVTELINTNTPFYRKEIEMLSATQVNLLKAVAQGALKFTAVGVMTEFKLGTPRNVSKNKTILVNSDVIQLVENRYEFVDPAFELWFRQNFLEQYVSRLFEGA